MKEESNTGNPSQEGSSDDFFNALENDVNSAIQDNITDDTTEVTPPNSDPEQETHVKEGSKSNESEVDWEKRYKDSTREAQKMHTELSELKPFVPVLNAMKQDSGLVDHVRDYLENGGTPSKTVTEKLGLDEDFVYDSTEALRNPDSDSAKVFEHSVDKIVSARVQNMLQHQQAKNDELASEEMKAKEEAEFKKEMGMSDEQFDEMMERAGKHRMTLNDLHLLVNQDKIKANAAKSSKDDMIKQMKNVRNIPTSASGANSAKSDDKTFEDSVFDAIQGTDDVDNLFG
jgi:hypothetical protein